MRITIIGSGYVGLVTGACLAEYGNDVMCLDIDQQKISGLQQGKVPIFEPGLTELIQKNMAAGRLQFTTNVEESVTFGTVQFIAVGTPPGEDGSADVKAVLAAAANIGRHMSEHRVIVNKSTVPVGTADRVRAAVQTELDKRQQQIDFGVVSNPEFLKEGAAIDDFMRPDRVVIGSEDQNALDIMQTIYAPCVRKNDRILRMDTRSAELTKYAANAMLATRISFMNELANLAELVGADIELVREGIGSDPRIGFHFLYPGLGYGGSCFPKDLRALGSTARQHGRELHILDAVERVNQHQKNVLFAKITRRFGKDLSGRRFALWGLAFKPNTDDMREAPSLVLIQSLLDAGAIVHAHDPVSGIEAKRILGDRIHYAATPLDALDAADALVIATEWKVFRSPDFDIVKARLKQPVIFDGRNMYDVRRMHKAGIEYHSIGRRQPKHTLPNDLADEGALRR
ncbi:MAG: nucleotide sugar dehydrogenase [Burkholderiaceae bacterium]|nr:nucleotide sugar dehydrogenase [Burkholderiaceae bacterium]